MGEGKHMIQQNQQILEMGEEKTYDSAKTESLPCVLSGHTVIS